MKNKEDLPRPRKGRHFISFRRRNRGKVPRVHGGLCVWELGEHLKWPECKVLRQVIEGHRQIEFRAPLSFKALVSFKKLQDPYKFQKNLQSHSAIQKYI